MNRSLLFGTLLLGMWAAPTLGDGPFQSMSVDFHRNNCWPEPFLYPDRAAVRAPFAVMVANGWRKQNMLADYHFDGTGLALNEAGKRKVQWVLTEAPEQHRTIFVHRAESPEKTSARVAAVQQLAASFMPAGQAPLIVETTVSPAGWPADRVDTIGRKFQSSTPEPRLSKSDGGGGATTTTITSGSGSK